MDIEYIKEFVTLSKLLSFSKAADLLHISQPTLSRHLSLLEDELGVCLMIRSRHSVYLTETGKLFLPKAKELLEKYDEAIRVTKTSESQTLRTLNVGVLYYGKEVLLEKVESFKIKYPDVSFRYLSATPGELVTALLEGKVDVAQVMHLDFKNSERLSFRDMYEEPLLLLVSDNHRLAHKSCVSMREIEDEIYISADDTFYRGFFSYVRSLCKIHNIHVQEPQLVPDYETGIMVVQAGHGVTVITTNMKRYLTGGAPLDILEEDFKVARGIAWRTDNNKIALNQFLHLFD